MAVEHAVARGRRADPDRRAADVARGAGAAGATAGGPTSLIALVAGRRGNGAALLAGAHLLTAPDALLDDAFAGPEPEDYFFGAFDLGETVAPPASAEPAQPSAPAGPAPAGPDLAEPTPAEAAPADAEVAPGAAAAPVAPAGPAAPADAAPSAARPVGAAADAPAGTVQTPAQLVSAVTRAAQRIADPAADPESAATVARARSGADRLVAKGRAFTAALAGRIAAGQERAGRGRTRPPVTDPVQVDPVPKATKALVTTAEMPLAPLPLPAPLAPPGRPAPTPATPPGVRAEELDKVKPPAPDPKERTRAEAARVADRARAAARAADTPDGPDTTPGKAEPEAVQPPVLLDLRLSPAPKPDDKQTARERASIQAVLVRVKADLPTAARAAAKAARAEAPYPAGLLEDELREHGGLWQRAIGDEALLPDIQAALTARSDELAGAAGIAAAVLDDAVLERQRILIRAGTVVAAETRKAVADAATRVTGEAEKAAGLAAAKKRVSDRKHLRELQAAVYSRDPRLVTQLLDERLAIVTDQVGRAVIAYEQAARRRSRLVDAYEIAYREAYRTADDAAQHATTPPQVPVGPHGGPWLRWAEDTLRRQMADLRAATATESAAKTDAVRTAGLDTRAALRDWADQRLRRDTAARDRDAERAADDKAQRDAEAATRKKIEVEAVRDGLVAQIRYAEGFHTLIQNEANGTLTEQQKKVLADGRKAAETYLKAGDDSTDPLSAVARHLVDQLSFEKVRELTGNQTIPKAIAQLHPTGTVDLSSLGRVIFAGKPPDADSRVSALSAATREQIGTEEDEVYNALDNLNDHQLFVIRTLYHETFHESLYYRLDSELSWSEKDRALALLRGDQAMAVAALIRYEQHSYFKRDRAKVIAAIKALPPGEGDKVKEKFEGEYDDGFDAALTQTLRLHRQADAQRVEVDDRAVEQAKLLLQVNLLRAATDADPAQIRRLEAAADSIELDRAMRPPTGKAKADAVDAVFTRIRDDVAGAHPEWTQLQVDDEVRRRNATVEQVYGDRFGATSTSKDPALTPLRRVMAAQLTDTGEHEIGKAMLDVDRGAEIGARLLLADRGAYAADSDLNAGLQANVDRAADEVRRSEGPKLRKELADRIKECSAAGKPMSQDELDAAERDIDRKLEKKINARAVVLLDEARAKWAGPGTLVEFVEDRTQFGGHTEARYRLLQGGGLTRAQQIYLAVRGWGMDRQQVLKATEGRTPDEIKEIADKFKEITDEDLTTRLHSETSGRTRFDVDEALRGIPLTAEQRMAALDRRHDYEATTYFWGGHKDALKGNLDLLNRQYNEAKARYARLASAPAELTVEDRNALQRSFAVQAGRATTAADQYRAAVDRYVDEWVQVAAAAVTILVAVALTLATGGAAAPLIALAASLWGTAATVVTKMVLLGGAYGIHEYADDLVVGAVDAATAWATAGLGDKLLGVAKATGATRLAMRAALARASAQRAAKPLVARIAVEAAEQFAGAAPSAIAGNVLNRDNWRGDIVANVIKGSAQQIATGMVVGGVVQGAMHGGMKLMAPVVESIQRWRGKVPEAALRPPSVDAELHEPTGPREPAGGAASAAERHAAMHDFLREHPSASPADFAHAVDEGRATARATPEQLRAFAEQARTEMLAGLPPSERAAFEKAPLAVLSSAEFTARTGSEAKGMAVVLVIDGEPHVVLREGAPLSALREEGLHLRQLADPAHASKLPLLDERRLAQWDQLSLEERAKSWEAKLELEVDAQRQVIGDLEQRLAAGGPDPALERQLTQARRSHETLAGRARELASFREAGGAKGATPPRFLDEPSRLFTKVDEPVAPAPPTGSHDVATPPKTEPEVDPAARTRSELENGIAQTEADLTRAETEHTALADLERRVTELEKHAAEAYVRARAKNVDPAEARALRQRETDARRLRRKLLDEFVRTRQLGEEDLSTLEKHAVLREELGTWNNDVQKYRARLAALNDRLNGNTFDPTMPQGGSYGEIVSAQGGDRHHCPADAASPLHPDDGPVVLMEKVDHQRTPSNGTGNDAIAYRDLQGKLIREGRFLEAVLMDVLYLRKEHGLKYERGIQQMLDYIAGNPDILKHNGNSTLTVDDVRKAWPVKAATHE